MRTPGERINDAALKALNLAMLEKQTALDQLVGDMQELEVAAARAKVEVRFIHHCQNRDPSLVPQAAERLAALEIELEGLGTSLNYRMEQAEAAYRQMLAFREFAGEFQRELLENAEVRDDRGDRQTDAQAA